MRCTNNQWMRKETNPRIEIGMFVHVDNGLEACIGRVVKMERVSGIPTCVSVHMFLGDEIKHYPDHKVRRVAYDRKNMRALLNNLTRDLT